MMLNFLIFSSMVIRDLTLRSAASFGSFHLIRLLYDEYMFYLIEHQVAEATGIVPIAVMVEGIVSYLVPFLLTLFSKFLLQLQKQDILQNSLSMYGNETGICNGSGNLPNNAKLGCVSPSDQTSKRMKIS